MVHGDRGRIVIVEGQHGVGKTRMAAQVFLHPGTINDVVTGVAMGNPYETERLVRTFSVWNVLIKQLVEEILVLRNVNYESDEMLRLEAITEIVRHCVHRADPTFAPERYKEVDELIDSFENGTVAQGIRSSYQPGWLFSSLLLLLLLFSGENSTRKCKTNLSFCSKSQTCTHTHTCRLGNWRQIEFKGEYHF